MIKTHERYKCEHDAVYFAEKHIKISDPIKGRVDFQPYSHQKDQIYKFSRHQKMAVLAPRQSGKTIAAIASILHYVMSNENKTIVIASPYYTNSRRILKQLIDVHEEIPLWLIPSIKESRSGVVKFSNGCEIHITSDVSFLQNIFRGTRKQIDFLYIDEAAYMKNIEHILESLSSYLSSDAKFLFTTSANKKAETYVKDLYQKAEHGFNDFAFIEIKWSDISSRDWTWKKDTEAAIGLKAFEQEYECQW